ncbi:MAG: hypothetical protein KatS3mg051_0746 [Anaerolineae bacterium]|nr:MAG: hypothetical protein KatS3mg051_0746 [Anaerolineae bacterium]
MPSAHEAGIHQDGVLKHQATYEIMTPETWACRKATWCWASTAVVTLSACACRNWATTWTSEQLNQAFQRFKELADKKKTVTDADIEALIADELYGPAEVFTLEGIQVACGQPGMPTATIKLRGPDGQVKIAAAIGTGPVDAAYQAIDKIVAVPATLVEYRVAAITEGIDAMGEVTVRIRRDANGKRTFGGHGADTDIIVASAKAYLAALNKMLAYTGYGDRAPEGEAATVRVTTQAR